MNNLWNKVLLTIIFILAAIIVWDTGIVVQQGMIREESGQYVYVIEYKVKRYEQEKTETDSFLNQGSYNQDRYVLPRSGGFDFWNWLNRK